MNQFIRDLNENTVVPQLIKNIQHFNQQIIAGTHFKIIHLNICGIKTNYAEFLCFLEKFKEKFEIIVLTETHIISDLQIYNLPGYDCVYSEGTFNRCDGIVVFVKESIKMESIFKLIGDVKCIELQIGENQQKFLLTCIYRSPSINGNLFVENFSDYLDLNKNRKKHIIIGDININLLKENKDPTENYKSVLAAYGYISYINKYFTRPLTKTCLDHIYVKGENENCFKNSNSYIIDYKITDHHPIALTFETLITNTHKIDIRTKSYTDYKKLRRDLQKEGWVSVFNAQDLNLAVSNFLHILQNKISENTKTIKQTNTKNGKNKWITKALLTKIKEKHILYNTILKEPQNAYLKNRYKIYKNQLTKTIKKCKTQFAQNQINKNKNKSDSLWKCVNQICNKSSQKTQIENIKTSGSQIITNKTEIANQFNKFFCEVGENLAKDINPCQNYTEQISWSNKSLYFLKETSDQEIRKIIKQLKLKKAPGPDGIRSETLKEISNEISPILSYLINLGFRIGDFPDVLKIGEIKPLFKSGSKTELGNYRPISLISNISKIFETAIKQRVVLFLEKQKLISPKQFGFRSGKSTEDAITNLTNEINEALDQRKPSLCVFIDLTKAFDTVCHEKLIQRLHQIGIRGSVKNLFQSYLTGRTQYVNIDGFKSGRRTVTCGVPQGTVLGPLLFTLYINNLLRTDWKGHLVSFADDTAIFYKGNSWRDLKCKAESDLSDIFAWFRYSKLTLNQAKTKFIPFSSYNSNLPDYYFLNVGQNNCISRVDNIKYLGIIIDQHLRWDKQVNNVLSKTRYLITRFYHLKDYLKVEQMKTIYFALVQSLLNYGIVGWGSVDECHLKKLNVVQKWILKIIFSKNKRFPSEQLFREAKIFDIRQLYFLNLLMLINKQKISLQSVSHEKSTRFQKNCMVVPMSRKQIGHKSINFLAPRFYNVLPKELKDIIFEKKFRNKTKQWMLQNNRNIIHKLFE